MPLPLSKRWALAWVALFGETTRVEHLLETDQTREKALRERPVFFRQSKGADAETAPKLEHLRSFLGESFSRVADYELAQRWAADLDATTSRFESWKSEAQAIDQAARSRSPAALASSRTPSGAWGSPGLSAGAQNSLLGLEQRFTAALDRLDEKTVLATRVLRTPPSLEEKVEKTSSMEPASDYGVLSVLARKKLVKFCREWRDFVNGGAVSAQNGSSSEALRTMFSPDALRRFISCAGPEAARATVGQALLSDIVAFFVESCEKAEARHTRALSDLARELVSVTLSLTPCNPAEQLPYTLFSGLSMRSNRSFLLQKIILTAPGLDLSPSALGPEIFRKIFISALQALWAEAGAQDQANSGRPDPKAVLTTRAQREEFSFLVGTAPWGLQERVDPDFAASFFSDRPALPWLSNKTIPPQLAEMAARQKPATVKEWLSLFLASDGIPCPHLSADAHSLLHRAHESMAALDEQRQLNESVAQAAVERRAKNRVSENAEPTDDARAAGPVSRPRSTHRL